jgi:hypothetical protein
MSNLTKYFPLIVTLAGTVGAAVFTPDFVSHHPTAFIVVNGVAQILHSVLPSIFKN